jgi:transposase
MAEAVLTLISGEESAKAIATRLGVSLQELRRWQKVFTEAGTAALAKLRSGGGGP